MDHETLRRVMEEHIPFNKFLGVRVVTIKKGYARIEIPFRPELVGDPMRPALHGGVISMLADTCGGMAVWSDIEDIASRVSTIDLRIDYLRPGKLETLVAEGSIVRVGNRVGLADIRLFHTGSEKDTIATGKGVYNVKIPKKSA
jgi:uncharacterized protein (TIGR00369 family)